MYPISRIIRDLLYTILLVLLIVYSALADDSSSRNIKPSRYQITPLSQTPHLLKPISSVSSIASGTPKPFYRSLFADETIKANEGIPINPSNPTVIPGLGTDALVNGIALFLKDRLEQEAILLLFEDFEKNICRDANNKILAHNLCNLNIVDGNLPIGGVIQEAAIKDLKGLPISLMEKIWKVNNTSEYQVWKDTKVLDQIINEWVLTDSYQGSFRTFFSTFIDENQKKSLKDKSINIEDKEKIVTNAFLALETQYQNFCDIAVTDPFKFNNRITGKFPCQQNTYQDYLTLILTQELGLQFPESTALLLSSGLLIVQSISEGYNPLVALASLQQNIRDFHCKSKGYRSDCELVRQQIFVSVTLIKAIAQRWGKDNTGKFPSLNNEVMQDRIITDILDDFTFELSAPKDKLLLPIEWLTTSNELKAETVKDWLLYKNNRNDLIQIWNSVTAIKQLIEDMSNEKSDKKEVAFNLIENSLNLYYDTNRVIKAVAYKNDEELKGLSDNNLNAVREITQNVKSLLIAFRDRNYSKGFVEVAALQNTLPADYHPLNSTTLKFMVFAADLASAQKKEDVKSVLESAAAPVGSYKLKHKKYLSSITAFVGIQGGLEDIQGGDIVANQNNRLNYSIFAPIGLDFSFPIGPSSDSNFGLFLSLIDVGVPLGSRSDTAVIKISSNKTGKIQNLDQYTIQSIMSPGLYFRYEWAGSPFTTGFGASIYPGLKNIVYSDNSVETVTVTRFIVFVAMDLTLYPF